MIAFVSRNLGVPRPQRDVPETEIARDLIRRALWVGPLFLGMGILGWGVEGALSAGLALVLVAFNFAAGAVIIKRTILISPNLLYGAVLAGYLVRLGIMTGSVLLVRATGWFDAIPFAVTLLVTHLGLLTVETRRVSASLAFPGLKPAVSGATKETSHQ